MPSNENALPIQPVRILVIGGCYGGLAAILALLDLSRGRIARFNFDKEAQAPTQSVPLAITLVDERDGYYHLIGSPKALASEEFADKTWTRFQDIPALQDSDITILQGSVTSVDCERKSAQILEAKADTPRELPYDYLVAASGLRRVFPTVPKSLLRDDFLAEAGAHAVSIRSAREGVVVVGGGAVGVEIAAELKELNPQQKVTLVHSRDRLLSSEPLPDELADRVATILRDADVDLVLGQRVVETVPVESEGRTSFLLTLSDGSKLPAGHVISAISRSVPTTTYLPPQALDEEGYVKIDASLQFNSVPNATYHFAAGDLVSWTGIKRCGAAIHMGHYAGTNIHQRIMQHATGSEPKFSCLRKIPPMISIALGHTAVSYTPDDGVKEGKELLKIMFGDDMGYSICWNYMKLGDAPVY
ncbi:hypothetical protein ASPZODRAFT_143722 [Penicilliopsis zonata CBS 506.65]|uniref:FAD/NAD(P)-binding domain-containing protein n=1 Tax=Penicilliopsis zonata CBS 506.65 TaxID=1073090 RepID=A0A1L9SF71_9EURO|nr:hypothetical protein ASPZODRAFT_143722 [Penicilliopsis zonata CBS 506.65]OJJ45846.1 hypothetical protein ASPZODRAFT_143722 [Penicilliopsis zonata CBS 506.65]